jgi:hypothetical protein
MAQLLNPGGFVVLTFPYNEGHYERDVYRLPLASYGKDHAFIGQVFSRQEVDGWCAENDLVIVEQDYYEAFTGDLWTFGTALHPLKRATRDSRHHLSCILLQKQQS